MSRVTRIVKLNSHVLDIHIREIKTRYAGDIKPEVGREAPVVYFAVAYRKIPGHYVTTGALRRIPRGDVATAGKSINAPRIRICIARHVLF